MALFRKTLDPLMWASAGGKLTLAIWFGLTEKF